MATFGERLKQLRIEANKTQREMSQYLGIATNAYQNYEYDKRDMNIKSLQILADYFSVTIDYLTGRIDDPLVRIVTPTARNILSDNRLSLEEKGLYMQLQYLALDNKVSFTDEEKFLTDNHVTREIFDGIIKTLEGFGYIKFEGGTSETGGKNSGKIYILMQ